MYFLTALGRDRSTGSLFNHDRDRKSSSRFSTETNIVNKIKSYFQQRKRWIVKFSVFNLRKYVEKKQNKSDNNTNSILRPEDNATFFKAMSKLSPSTYANDKLIHPKTNRIS